jgi:hypothetical protein
MGSGYLVETEQSVVSADVRYLLYCPFVYSVVVLVYLWDLKVLLEVIRGVVGVLMATFRVLMCGCV